MSEPDTLDNDPRLRALLQWRHKLIGSGVVSSTGFKEAHVRLVHRSGRTDVEQIRMMLPAGVCEHAEEMARVLAEVDDSAVEGPTHDATAQPGVERPPLVGVDGQRADAPPGQALALPSEAFAPFAFGEQPGTRQPVTLRRADGDALALSWPPYPAPYAAYRVVSAEEHPPYSPDRAHLLAATTDTTAVDGRPASSALRHYQVWVNAGTSRTEALAAQPILYAAGVMVATVRDMVVQEDSGRVIGQWTVFPGVRAVHVERVPLEEATSGGHRYRILADSDNLGGFVDANAERGRRYRYRARCEVLVDGVARLSGVAQAEVAVLAVLSPVADLGLTMLPSDPVTFDLSFTPPPAGRVAIFRTQGAPRADAEATRAARSGVGAGGSGS